MRTRTRNHIHARTRNRTHVHTYLHTRNVPLTSLYDPSVSLLRACILTLAFLNIYDVSIALFVSFL